MKRYYDENGEPDEAKTLWGIINNTIKVVAVVSGACIIWDHYTREIPKVSDESYWKNAYEQPITEVKYYDYDKGIIHWRDEIDTGVDTDFKLNPTSGYYGGGGIELKVQGATIILDMPEEELLDMLMENSDFYDYLDRYTD